jgi:hypothetical protein
MFNKDAAAAGACHDTNWDGTSMAVGNLILIQGNFISPTKHIQISYSYL